VSRWGSPQVEPEHVLLGIIREGKGAAYELLFEEFQLDWRALAQSIEARLEKKPRFDTSVEIPFSKSAKEVITATAEEAERLQHPEIGTEHLLLGILRTDSMAASVLAEHGVTLELAREKL